MSALLFAPKAHPNIPALNHPHAGRQKKSPGTKFFSSLRFTDHFEFLWGRFENAQPLALALRIQTSKSLSE
jgi:hypothetical protein